MIETEFFFHITLSYVPIFSKIFHRAVRAVWQCEWGNEYQKVVEHFYIGLACLSNGEENEWKYSQYKSEKIYNSKICTLIIGQK